MKQHKTGYIGTMTTERNYLPHIAAVLTFLSSQEGGRQTPVYSGYRPQFSYDGADWDAIHDYDTDQPVYPGQSTPVNLTFLCPEYHADRLYVGKVFHIREGRRIIAHGRITEIIHLRQAARAAEQLRPKQFYWYTRARSHRPATQAWGRCTYYLEVNVYGNTDMQLEVYDNHQRLFYDSFHRADTYGQLGDHAPIDTPGTQQIDRDTFDRVRQMVQHPTR